MPLSKDLIIFKSQPGNPDGGVIWRLMGDYPDWQVVEVAHNTGTFGVNSVCTVGNDVYYVTPNGIASLSTVTDYGEIKAKWPDRKVSKRLNSFINNTAQLWNVPMKQQLWLRPNNEMSIVFVFDYSKGIWTEFDYSLLLPILVAESDGNVYLFTEDRGYQVMEERSRDEISKGNFKEIYATMKLGTIESAYQTLAKTAGITYRYQDRERDYESSGKMLIGKYELAMKNDGNINWNTARSRFIVRDYSITPEIQLLGKCAVSRAAIEIAEV